MSDSTRFAADADANAQVPTHDPLSCSPSTVDEHAGRVVAGIVLSLALVSLWHPTWWLTVLLAADFFVRAWVGRTYSPVRWIAKRLTRTLGLSAKPVYAPPKQFAARIGSVLTLVIVAAHLLGLALLATAATLALVVAASLEALAGFCIACWVYPCVFRTRDA